MHSVYDDEYYDFESIEGGNMSEIDDEYTAYTPMFNAESEDETMEGGDKAIHDHKTISYNPYEFVSKCCKAFLFYDKLGIYCSKCSKEVDRIQPGQSITIGVKFNSTTEETSISGDILRAFHNSIPRFATDPTCELCERKCAKCSTKMRYLRDRKGDMWYVCSNKDCRHVDTPNDLVIVDE
jgi:hypothetical protein